MFTSLRMFDEAKAWAEEAARLGKAGAGSGAGGEGGSAAGGLGAGRVADLMGRQAAWNEETANYEAAVEMYIKVGGVVAGGWRGIWVVGGWQTCWAQGLLCGAG